jgi:hypothetical protein
MNGLDALVAQNTRLRHTLSAPNRKASEALLGEWEKSFERKNRASDHGGQKSYPSVTYDNLSAHSLGESEKMIELYVSFEDGKLV